MDARTVALTDGREVVLRGLRESDAAALITYLDTVRRETPFLLWGPADDLPTLEKEQQWVRGRIEHPCAMSVSGWVGEQCVALAQIEAATMFQRRRHTASVGISVLGAYHGVGLGTKLMQVLLDWARAQEQIHVVELTVLAHNERAIRTYRRVGFKETGRKPRAVRYEDGRYVDELQMSVWTGPAGAVDVAPTPG